MTQLELSKPIGDFYRGKRVLVTGHTGFKGSWLCRWLQLLGADVSGFALAPEGTKSLFEGLSLAESMRSSLGDVRQHEAIEKVVAAQQPEIVFHLAAQALVRQSFKDPLATFDTNVMGTANLLEACRGVESVRSIVVITTDKVYENREWCWGYREGDPLGGYDPYSASKAAAELVTAAYRQSFLSSASGPRVASARAGNVIGGGDWAADRLIPDIVASVQAGQPVDIRNPRSTRPWQHVLEPLFGYLLLAKRLHDDPDRFADSFNFGPHDEDAVEVGALAPSFIKVLGQGQVRLAPVDPDAPHEAQFLKLDTSKARSRLGWKPALRLRDTLEMTASWYRDYLAAPASAKALTDAQIRQYAALRLNHELSAGP